ncbi:hypothetical protein ACRALDRAFT_2031930 [Sodiomyces alcalophilus JCM 7366]|uniref:uncharacterized protein n=1 Tax=Sodiomyces alcalophilus JCM 7366 TaxID=591952 RepID=UPI0039B5535D
MCSLSITPLQTTDLARSRPLSCSPSASPHRKVSSLRDTRFAGVERVRPPGRGLIAHPRVRPNTNPDPGPEQCRG